MPTTAIHPGCAFCRTCAYANWGDVTEAESRQLGDALVERFNELARACTGDPTICWQPYTSEIIFECHGQTTPAHHCLAPVHPWPVDEDGIPTVDFNELRQQAAEWTMDHYDQIVRG